MQGDQLFDVLLFLDTTLLDLFVAVELPDQIHSQGSWNRVGSEDTHHSYPSSRR